MTAWHVVQTRAGERVHSLVYEFLDGHRAGRHGPIAYCRALGSAERDDLALLRAEFELGMALGRFPRHNQLRGFKWTTDIRSTFPSAYHEEAARLLSQSRGRPISCPFAAFPSS